MELAGLWWLYSQIVDSSSQSLPTSSNLHKSAFYQHMSLHFVEDKRTSLWKNIRACFAVGLCPVLLTSAAQLIEVAINYHNCLFWLLGIHLPSLCQLIHLAQPLFPTAHKHYECSGSLQSVYTAPSLPYLLSFRVNPGSHSHVHRMWPSCCLLLKILILLFIALTVAAWFLQHMVKKK